MRYEVLEERQEEGGLVEAFATDYKEGAIRVAAAMVDCAKNDCYDYLIQVKDTETNEVLLSWDSLELPHLV